VESDARCVWAMAGKGSSTTRKVATKLAIRRTIFIGISPQRLPISGHFWTAPIYPNPPKAPRTDDVTGRGRGGETRDGNASPGTLRFTTRKHQPQYEAPNCDPLHCGLLALGVVPRVRDGHPNAGGPNEPHHANRRYPPSDRDWPRCNCASPVRNSELLLNRLARGREPLAEGSRPVELTAENDD
jgi:hypothetical protein